MTNINGGGHQQPPHKFQTQVVPLLISAVSTCPISVPKNRVAVQERHGQMPRDVYPMIRRIRLQITTH